jgi:hypothetical protein
MSQHACPACGHWHQRNDRPALKPSQVRYGVRIPRYPDGLLSERIVAASSRHAAEVYVERHAGPEVPAELVWWNEAAGTWLAVSFIDPEETLLFASPQSD